MPDVEEKVVPISASVTPTFDGEFEFMDWFARKVRAFVAEYGHPPDSIALVMADGKVTVTGSFTPDPETRLTPMMIRGLAIAALTADLARYE